MNIRSMFIGAAAASGLLLALPASAASLGVGVSIDGVYQGYYGDSALGCQAIPDTPTAICSGSDTTIGSLRLDSWNIFADADPVISGNVVVTNLSAFTTTYTLNFILPIAPAIPGGTVIGGSIQGGATDNNGDGVTLSAPLASAFYTARIDGVDVQSLYPAPASFSTGSYLSLNVPNASFGTPIPSQPGPAALSTIGIRLNFTLSAYDSASFTSNFVVQPVPVPAAVWMLGSALGLLGWIRRRAA